MYVMIKGDYIISRKYIIKLISMFPTGVMNFN